MIVMSLTHTLSLFYSKKYKPAFDKRRRKMSKDLDDYGQKDGMI